MTILKRILTIFLVFLMFSTAFAHRRVLFISSYSQGFPTAPQHLKSLHEVFDEYGIVFDTEYMDSKRVYTAESVRLFKRFIKYKLEHGEAYDLIMTADDNAINFVLQNKAELFRNLPVVFFGVNNEKIIPIADSVPLVTGVMESPSFSETIKLIKLMHKDLTKIYVIHDNTVSGMSDFERFSKVRKDFMGIRFVPVNSSIHTFEEFSDFVERIDGLDPVLLLSSYQFKDEERVDFSHQMKMYKEHLHSPLYHLWEHGIGQGVLGGHVVSHENQARVAAEIAMKIFKGTTPDKIPIVIKSPNKYMFDAKEMQWHGVRRALMPSGSDIVNDTKSVITKNMVLFYAFVLIISIFSLVLFILYSSVKRRKALETELSNKNRELSRLNVELESKIENEIEKRVSIEKQFFESSKHTAMGEMLRNIAHQWRQPLNALGLMIQDVRDVSECEEGVTIDYLKEFEGISMELIKGMSKTIDSFTSMYHQSQSVYSSNAIEVLVNSVKISIDSFHINDMYVDFVYNLDSSGELELGQFEQLNLVASTKGSPTKLTQVFHNILTNAKESMLRRMERDVLSDLKLKIEIYQKEGNLCIDFIDQGVGFSHEALKRAFEPYYSTKEDGEGTGLGLYIAYSIIVEQCDGKMSVENHQNGGMVSLVIPEV